MEMRFTKNALKNPVKGLAVRMSDVITIERDKKL